MEFFRWTWKSYSLTVQNFHSNLNALYGAIQQTDRLIAKLKDGDIDKKEMPPEKEKALILATS